jgi:6-phosphogluconolactonase (cycloisomerase 2 family)
MAVALLLMLSLILSSSRASGQEKGKRATREVLYGAPADTRINTFPVMDIDRATGGFVNVFNVNAPPPFLCSGGAAAVGTQFLYVSLPPGCQNTSSEIIGYSLQPHTGAPVALNGSPFPMRAGSIPSGMAALPNGNLLYVADASGSIAAFAVDSTTGALKEIHGSPFKAGANSQLVIDPSGKYLYASDDAFSGGVLAFSIGAGGRLTRVPGSPFLIPGKTVSNYQPFGIADTGKYVYTALSATNQIAGFSVNAETGVLTPLPSLFSTGNGPGPLAWSGNFLYTVNQLDGTISGYSIDGDSGALTTVPGSPFGTDGALITIDFTGKYLYLSMERGVQGFNIDPTTGALSQGPGFHDNNGVLWLTVAQVPTH